MSHQKIHETAVIAAKNHRKTEMELLNALEQVWRNRSYYKFGCHSLFEYSTKQLKMSDELASIFNKLAKKFTEVPELKTQMETGELSVSKINRIASIITPENVLEWCEHAKGTKRNLEKQIAKAHPEKAIPERARYKQVGETTLIQITYAVSEDKFKEIQRAQDLLSQKLKRAATIQDVHDHATQLLLEKMDPLKKSCPPNSTSKLTIKRKVHQKYDGQCTHIDENGERCTQQRHLDIHHQQPRSKGGTDEIENLTILCSGHHRGHHRH